MFKTRSEEWVERSRKSWDLDYIQMYSRIPSYIIGILLGWVLRNKIGRKLNKVRIIQSQFVKYN